MTVDEIQKYNKIVADTAKEIAQGYVLWIESLQK